MVGLMLDRIVKLLRHLGVDALERLILGHRGGFVVDRAISESEIEVSLGQVWSKLDHFFIRLNRFRITTCVVERKSEIEMSGRVLRLYLGGFLERSGRFVVTLQTVVSVAEVFVGVRADLVSLLKSEFVCSTSLAEQLDGLKARVDSLLILIVMVICKTKIVIDLETGWIALQRFFVNVDCLRIAIESRQRKRQRQIGAVVIRLYSECLLIGVNRLRKLALVHVDIP